MPIERDEAIVLRLTEYSETSQIATLFAARVGLLRLIAKGIKRGTAKRVAAGLDLLEYGQVHFVPAHGDATLGTMTEWSQRDTFSGLRRALPRLYAGLYSAELVTALTEEDDPHPELFEALHTVLGELAADGAVVAPLIARFQADFLNAVGYTPVLDECVSCHAELRPGEPLYFSTAAGGLLCRDCEMHYVEKQRVSPAIITSTPQTGDGYTWFTLFDYHLRNLVGRRMKSAPQLDTLLKPRRT
ncbi:MAG: DNA repair protein RecO [Phycisphaerae bacterium]|nr:DNA repair protein RecO [Phycisphaerae bacterium]